MTHPPRTRRISSGDFIARLSFAGVIFGAFVFMFQGHASAQPAPGFPPARPDFRDDWMKESDWIWRDRRHQYSPHHYSPHHSPHGSQPWAAPYYGTGFSSGFGGWFPYPWSMPFGGNDPYRPSLYDPACRTGQAPAQGAPAAGPVAEPSLAPSPEDGKVDPGSRRYVNRWQRSGRGYIHVHGWEWTSHGVPKQKLNKEFVDRSELDDRAILEAVPAPAPPDDPVDATANAARNEPRGPADSLFQSLDANGDGQISAEEFRVGLRKPKAD